MQSRLHGADRHLDQSRGLFIGQAQVVVEGEDDPVIGFERLEGPLQLTAGQRAFQMIDRIDPPIRKTDLKTVAASCSPRASNLVLPKPGTKGFRLTKTGQVAPGADECVLHCVGGIAGSAQNEPGAAER